QQLLEALPPPPAEAPAMGGGAPAPMVGMRGGPGGMMPGMAMPGGFPAGLGALGIGGGGLAGPSYRAAMDARTPALVVAGSGRDVAVAADFVTAMNAPADKPLPKLEHLRAYRLRFADPAELAAVFQQLELEASIVPGPQGSKLLFAAGADELLQELDEAVKALDVQGEKKAAGPKT